MRQKKIKFYLTILTMMTCFWLTGVFCTYAMAKPPELYTIAVASDLHIDPENRGAGVVNPLVIFNVELTDALLYDVQEQNADILLLCGDLSNAGRELQHEVLAKKLEAAEKQGLSVYVLPGNHDIGNVTAEQFARLYADFGFQEAFSQDTDSLSYSILLDDYLILMLDTDGYSGRTGGAYVSEETLGWIKKQLELAKENHWEVLAAGHYSVLNGQTTEFIGQEQLETMLEYYQVPLYICGHLHQNQVTLTDQLTELVVEQANSYPCSYALLYKEGENAYRYVPRVIDVNGWARNTGQTSKELLEFDIYEETLFQEKSKETIEYLIKDHGLTIQEKEQVRDFFQILQKSYAWGELYDHLDELYSHPGYEHFMRIAEGTVYGKWIPIIMENAVPYTSGFTLPLVPDTLDLIKE